MNDRRYRGHWLEQQTTDDTGDCNHKRQIPETRTTDTGAMNDRRHQHWSHGQTTATGATNDRYWCHKRQILEPQVKATGDSICCRSIACGSSIGRSCLQCLSFMAPVSPVVVRGSCGSRLLSCVAPVSLLLQRLLSFIARVSSLLYLSFVAPVAPGSSSICCSSTIGWSIACGSASSGGCCSCCGSCIIVAPVLAVACGSR